MNNLYEEYNNVKMQGKVISEKVLNHEIYGEKFYTFNLEVPRLSEAVDIIPVILSERLIEGDNIKVGSMVKINGQYRSYNSAENEKSRLVLMVFVKEIETIEEVDTETPSNEIELNGFLCKKPIYRMTPLGREIVDMLLAVNRAYNKSDYIPVIAWGRNAKYCENLEVGKNIKISGRIQSRQYEKKYPDGTSEIRNAYEVSVNKLEVIE
ncbi:MAG: single-stranded DNA-binding protein [Clostridiales bacterium]|nr:single-stranded DNA-binding protein [Clostridiales bacterium]